MGKLRIDSALHRDEKGRKRCCTCQLYKDLDEFAKVSISPDGLQYRCRRCYKEARLKLRYGLTIKEAEALLEAQTHSCAICRKAVHLGQKDTHIDHCHTTGKVRGILCGSCNRGLGLFGDDQAQLQAAIEYLELR